LVYNESENIEKEVKQRSEQAIRQIQTGGYLQKLRVERNLRLIDVSSKINISPNFLSEIEKGKRIPSDSNIRKLAKLYNVDEIELFDMYGKIALSVKEELIENKGLQKTLILIRESGMSGEDKVRLYDGFYEMYKSFCRSVD